MTQPTRPGGVVGGWSWKGPSMPRDDADPRPTAPAGTSVANPRRTQLLREALTAGRDDAERPGR